MDIKEIRQFIDSTVYDFETIEHFLTFGRVKETLPVMEKIIRSIQQFRSRADTGSDELKNIFHEIFWDKVFFQKLKMGDMCIKIKESAQDHGTILDKDLESIEYQRFIRCLRGWVYENIYQLREEIKTPWCRKIESALIILSAFVLGLCLFSIVLVRPWVQDWGLKGDFYEGLNFDRHVSSGYNLAIDFGNNLEINPQLSNGNFSARWQGFLKIPGEGKYTLFVKARGGVRLFIDGNLLIDEWHDHNSAEFNKEVFLKKGKHWLYLEYYNNSNKAVLRLYWAKEKGRKEIIPPWYLSNEGDFLTGPNVLRAQILIFTPKDVESGKGWVQKLHNNYLHAPTQDHLLAKNPDGILSVVKYFEIPQRSRYLVKVFHASAMDYVDAQIRISCIPPVQVAMSTWSPVSVFGYDSYVCEFPEGKNSVHISGVRKGSKIFLGVNSIVLYPF